jgi:LPS export ABC transporter protein LptC
MIKFLMKKVFMTGLSVLLFISLFLMLRTGRENTGDLQIKKGNSFIEDIRILQKKKGATVWTLTASKADFKEGENKAELSDIHMALPKNDVVLRADKGIYDFSERSLTTESVVKAEAKDYKITADSIDYEISSGKISTGGRIKVEGRGFMVEGKGMKADTEQKVRIYNDVKATFQK